MKLEIINETVDERQNCSGRLAAGNLRSNFVRTVLLKLLKQVTILNSENKDRKI
jgi:hypothetical protein